MRNRELLFVRKINVVLRKILTKTHKREMDLTWNTDNKVPTFFNHFLDIYYQLFSFKKTEFLTRAIFNQLFLESNNIVLELGCGDGFNTEVFFSPIVKEIYAIDLSEEAISFAKINHSSKNITYKLGDAIIDYPIQKKIDRVICDAFLEQLDTLQQEELFKKISNSLSLNGICLGSTILKGNINYLIHNKNEFTEATFNSFVANYFKYSFSINKSVDNKNYKYFALSNEPISYFKLIKND